MAEAVEAAVAATEAAAGAGVLVSGVVASPVAVEISKAVVETLAVVGEVVVVTLVVAAEADVEILAVVGEAVVVTLVGGEADAETSVVAGAAGAEAEVSGEVVVALDLTSIRKSSQRSFSSWVANVPLSGA